MHVPGIETSAAATAGSRRRADSWDGPVFRLALDAGTPATSSSPTVPSGTSATPGVPSTGAASSPAVSSGSVGSGGTSPVTPLDPSGAVSTSTPATMPAPGATLPVTTSAPGAATGTVPADGGTTSATPGVSAGEGQIGVVHMGGAPAAASGTKKTAKPKAPTTPKETTTSPAADPEPVAQRTLTKTAALAERMKRIADRAEKVETLKSGAKLYHLPGGRVIEQAPGHTPYVVDAGDSKLWPRR